MVGSGKTVLFECGDTWQDADAATLNIQNSTTDVAYGTGAKPRFDFSKTATGWTCTGSNNI